MSNATAATGERHPARRAWVGAAGLVGAGVVAHLLPGVAAWRRMRCQLAPRLSGVGETGHIALTFDDGPDPASTPAFLDLLDQLNWKATFFLLGSQVEKAPALAAEVAARGHEIGVHGYRHISHLRRPTPWVTDDIKRGRALIEDATGQTMRWMRPPYGALAASSLMAARRTGLQTVLWTSWGHDWRADATAASVAGRINATWWPGATVLLHDSDVTSAPGSWRSALGALELLASQWAEAGLRVGTLSEHGISEHGISEHGIAAPDTRALP